MKPPVRILTMLFGHIGDTLMVVALFDDILALEPDARFLIITKRNAGQIRDLTAAYPSIEVKEIPRGLKALPFLIGLLKQRWVFLALGLGTALEYSFPLKLFLKVLSLIPGNESIGLGRRIHERKRWLPLRTIVKPDESATLIDNFRTLLPYLKKRPFNVVLTTSMPAHFPYTPGQYMVAHLFGVSRFRSFPLRRWKVLFASLASTYPHLPIIFTGAASDKAMIEEIAAVTPGAYMCIGLPLLHVAGIIDNAALYIGVDTGITHIAGALKQKSIVIRHVGDPRWMPTYNPHARILINTTRCTCIRDGTCTVEEEGVLYTRCMYDISDKMILDSVALGLSSKERSIDSFAGIKDEKIDNGSENSIIQR